MMYLFRIQLLTSFVFGIKKIEIFFRINDILARINYSISANKETE